MHGYEKLLSNVLDIDGLITSKKGMGRAKDEEAIAQLKAIKEKSK